MSTLTEQRRDLIADAKAIALRAKAAGRGLTAEEITSVNDKLSSVKQLDEQISDAKSSADLIARIGALPDGGEHRPIDGTDPTGGHYLALGAAGRKSLGGRVAGKMREASALAGAKALLPSGEIASPIEMTTTSPLAQGRVIPGLLSVLPVVQHTSPRFAYLRQTSRSNNAAPVASGGLKPTSLYGLRQIVADLVVVAHVSEGIDKFMLEDAASLTQFIGDEMLFGLNQALEGQLLNGSGVAPNMFGLLNTSGIQTQPATAGDLLGTLRSAVTKLEAVGHNPGVWVLHPSDWERAELTKAAGTGEYLLGTGPVDRAARKLWGIPVALSVAVPVGTAVLLDVASVALDTDTAGVRIEWSTAVGDDFSRNLIRARCEGRFALSVYQGFGVIKVTLPAAA